MAKITQILWTNLQRIIKSDKRDDDDHYTFRRQGFVNSLLLNSPA